MLKLISAINMIICLNSLGVLSIFILSAEKSNPLTMIIAIAYSQILLMKSVLEICLAMSRIGSKLHGIRIFIRPIYSFLITIFPKTKYGQYWRAI